MSVIKKEMLQNTATTGRQPVEFFVKYLLHTSLFIHGTFRVLEKIKCTDYKKHINRAS